MQETDLLKLEKVSTLSLPLYIIALPFILARSSNARDTSPSSKSFIPLSPPPSKLAKKIQSP